MKMCGPLFSAVFLGWFGTGTCHSRTWTNTEGREIEADYVSNDGTKVLLRLNGKEVPYPLEKLSEADREWVAKQAAKPETPQPSEMVTGLRRNLPLTARLYPDLEGYSEDRTRRKVFDAFRDGAWSDGDARHDDPKKWMERDAAKDLYDLYVPATYDGKQPYGLYLHISPGNGGGIPAAWQPVFDQRKLIAVSAHGTGNDQQMMRRVTLSVDAMHTAMQTHRIDPKRCVVGGLSGGGHMAMLTAAMFPERFVGAVSHAAQSYLPSVPNRGSHFPGMDVRDFKRPPRKEIKWVVISGDKDMNYKEIQLTTAVWTAERLNYRFIDVPGMGHTNAQPGDFAKALDWILEPSPSAGP